VIIFEVVFGLTDCGLSINGTILSIIYGLNQ